MCTSRNTAHHIIGSVYCNRLPHPSDYPNTNHHLMDLVLYHTISSKIQYIFWQIKQSTGNGIKLMVFDVFNKNTIKKILSKRLINASRLMNRYNFRLEYYVRNLVIQRGYPFSFTSRDGFYK